jgi:hypothetical protein
MNGAQTAIVPVLIQEIRKLSSGNIELSIGLCVGISLILLGSFPAFCPSILRTYIKLLGNGGITYELWRNSFA